MSVPVARAEEVRRRLLDGHLLRTDVRISRQGDRVFLPTVERVDVGLPVERRAFEAPPRTVRSYKDLAEVPDALRARLPSSFDVIGDIAVVRIQEDLVQVRGEIGRAILAANRALRVVARDRGVKGAHRVRDLEVIAGEPRTRTVHVEYGLRYAVDVAAAYFSPRLGTERMRVASRVRAGEVVVDPFAGVGPYAILIARTRDPAAVVASDANPVAVELLRANVAANRADRVDVREGDARAVLRGTASVDRVILDLPHSALDFLADAIRALREGGTAHLYGIVGAGEREGHAQEVTNRVEREGRSVADLQLHTVRAFSPRRDVVAFDLTVGPG